VTEMAKHFQSEFTQKRFHTQFNYLLKKWVQYPTSNSIFIAKSQLKQFWSECKLIHLCLYVATNLIFYIQKLLQDPPFLKNFLTASTILSYLKCIFWIDTKYKALRISVAHKFKWFLGQILGVFINWILLVELGEIRFESCGSNWVCSYYKM